MKLVGTQHVQCKQWRTTKVGVGPIRELAGVVATEKASGGIFVCSGRYTDAAGRFAEDSGIRLIREHNLAEFIQLPAKAESVDQFRCPRCSNTLVTRIARKGVNAGKSFLGCSAFPKM
ncbi:MAG: restriction endonuclease [bacterium]